MGPLRRSPPGLSPWGQSHEAELLDRYGRSSVGPRVVSIPEPPSDDHVAGLGPLHWAHVVRADGVVEVWRWNPKARLAYDARTRRQLWIVGGAYVVDSRGFRNLPGRGDGLERLPMADAQRAHRRQDRLFRQHHGGLAPTEAYRGCVRVPERVVLAGTLRAIAYRTDRTLGEMNYEHVFDEPRPHVAVGDGLDEGTSQVVILGGAYTVVRGWIDG